MYRNRINQIYKTNNDSLISLALIVVTVTFAYMNHPTFGKSTNGKRLEHLKKSPNFKDGIFQKKST